ncbi:MAG: hypothetical protein ACPGOY_09785 [Rhodospirillaceae bacterium]
MGKVSGDKTPKHQGAMSVACSPKTAVFGLFVLCLAWAGAGGGLVSDAQASVCPPPREAPDVSITTSFPDVTEDYSLDRRQIHEKAERARARGNLVEAPLGFLTLGLTDSEYVFRWKTKTRFRARPGGGFCVYLQQLSLEIQYSRVTIFVPSDYPATSCPHRVIREHEFEHVEINRRTLIRMRHEAEDQVSSILQNQTPVYMPTEAQARAAFSDNWQPGFDVALDRAKKVMAREHAAIDTAESYRATSRLCPLEDWRQ